MLFALPQNVLYCLNGLADKLKKKKEQNFILFAELLFYSDALIQKSGMIMSRRQIGSK